MGHNLFQATQRPSADRIKKTITVLVSVGAFLGATITALVGRKKKRLLASSCLTVRLSARRMEHLGSRCTNCHEILHNGILIKPLKKSNFG
jgi:hypothetical protein